MLLNENESYLVLVTREILLVTISNVYWYKTRNALKEITSQIDYYLVKLSMFLKPKWQSISQFD